MRSAAQTANQELEARTFAPLMTVMAVAEVAFIFGLIMRLSWQACALIVLVSMALAAGLIFTIVEMQRLVKEDDKRASVRGT